MKNTKLLVVALLVALLACLTANAMADVPACPTGYNGLHNMQVVSEQPAGCVTQGTRTYVCQNANCGYSTVEFLNPVGHKWSDWQQRTGATCANPGIQQQQCTVCGVWNTETIRYTPAATGAHDYSVTVAAGSAATCTLPGKKAIIKCSVCGQIDPNNDGADIAAKGHNYNGAVWEPVPGTKATCLAKAKIRRACVNGCGTYEIMETGDLGDHAWVLTIPAKDPTCTETGCKAQYQCSVCGIYKGGEEISANGHDLNGVAWTVDWEATCGWEGSIVRICRVCGAKVERQSTPKNSNHDWNEIVPAVPASCYNAGATAVKQCTICGATTGGATVAQKSHVFSKWTTVPATCTVDGYTYATCDLGCGHIQKIVIKATGHDAPYLPIGVLSDGQVQWQAKCTLCGTVLHTTTLPAGQTPGSATVTTGKAAADKNYTGVSSTKVVETAKTTTTKKSSTASSAKKTTTTTKAATTTEKKVEETATPSAELKFGVAEYKVGDVTITLNPDYTFTAELADGETVALFADADALATPAEGNFVALSATEATELPEGFVPTLVAVVKEADLPVATAIAK